jgi:Tol biopolymer transport system component
MRIEAQRVTVVILNTATGEQQDVVTLPPPRYRLDYRLLDWSPDGRFLAVSHSDNSGGSLRLSLINLTTRQIGVPLAGVTGTEDWDDVAPRFSPDGKHVAFVRRYHRLGQELFTAPVAGGNPRQVTRLNRQISDHDWSAEGDALVAALLSEGEYRLWRIPAGASGSAPGRSLGIYGEFPIHLSVARTGQTLAYSLLHQDRNIWSLDLNARRFTRVAASSGQDASPQFSPDGQEICFRSDRSGDEHLWVSQADGSGAVQITQGSMRPSVGRWSPNGQAIVFNDPRDSAIYLASRQAPDAAWTVRATGWTGVHPVFAKDGQSLYAGGPDAIVHISLADGRSEVVVKTHGFSLDLAPESDHIYFVRDPNGTTLWRADLRTGAVEKAVEGLVAGCTSCWALSRQGLYYLSESANSRQDQILLFQPAAGGAARQIIAWPEYLWPMGSGPFSLSPDQRSLLAVRVDPSDSDVMLVTPFR